MEKVVNLVGDVSERLKLMLEHFSSDLREFLPLFLLLFLLLLLIPPLALSPLLFRPLVSLAWKQLRTGERVRAVSKRERECVVEVSSVCVAQVVVGGECSSRGRLQKSLPLY